MIIFPARILGLLTQKLTDAPQRLIDVPAHIADKAATLVDAATISAHVVANKVAKSAASTVASVTTFDPTVVLAGWKAAALHWAGATSLYGVAAFAAWFAVRWVWQREIHLILFVFHNILHSKINCFINLKIEVFWRTSDKLHKHQQNLGILQRRSGRVRKASSIFFPGGESVINCFGASTGFS
jgi:hypothetical protein